MIDSRMQEQKLPYPFPAAAEKGFQRDESLWRRPRRTGVQGQSPAAVRAEPGCRGRAPPLSAQDRGAGAEPRRQPRGTVGSGVFQLGGGRFPFLHFAEQLTVRLFTLRNQLA